MSLTPNRVGTRNDQIGWVDQIQPGAGYIVLQSPTLLAQIARSSGGIVVQVDSQSETDAWQYQRLNYNEWVFVEGDLAHGFRLTKPIYIHLWIEGEEFVADAPLLYVHAFGERVDEALDNLGEAIIDRLLFLRKHGTKLSPRMHDQLRILEYYIGRSDA